LCAGASGHVVQEFDPGQILELIESARLNKIFTVPAALRMIMRHPRAREVSYARIRTIVYGSSPIPLDLLREALELFRCRFVQQYGMTEMCGTVVVLPPEDHVAAGSDRMRSAGKALAGVEIAILGPDGTRLTNGEIGEVAIRSPTVMRGYWKAPEQTSAVLTSDGWFRTGDAGYLDADGYLFLQDRIKDMIVSGGENVFPAEVENAIWEHPAVREVAVIGVPDEKWGEAVKAIVVREPGSEVDAQAIQQWARGRIAGYKIPKSVDFVESLPRNHSGKVLRRELRAPFWEGRSRGIN
jgi:long-chain acyl-CoA synthetase